MVDYQALRTVKQLAAEASWVTEAKLRWWIFHAQSNGLSAALIKIGGRVYIDRAEFNRWLEAQRLTVNRLAKQTPYRRPKLTPLS